MEKPRFYFRVSEDDLADLKKRAKLAKQTPSEYARMVLFDKNSDQHGSRRTENGIGSSSDHGEANPEEFRLRLMALEESIDSFRTLFKETSTRIEVAAMAGVASAAMLADTSKVTGDAATKIMVTHIEDALRAAPKIIEHRQKSA